MEKFCGMCGDELNNHSICLNCKGTPTVKAFDLRESTIDSTSPSVLPSARKKEKNLKSKFRLVNTVFSVLTIPLTLYFFSLFNYVDPITGLALIIIIFFVSISGIIAAHIGRGFRWLSKIGKWGNGLLLAWLFFSFFSASF